LLCALALTGCVLPFGPGASFRAWQRQAAELRELDFGETEVRMRWIDHDEAIEVLRGELEGAYDPEYLASYEAGYKAMGLLPADLDLIATLLELQQEQIVGLYSPSDDVLYVRGDLPPAYGDEADILQIVVHELVHALQARHFPDTLGLLRGLRHNDDVGAGITAAVEGDASLTMLGVPTDVPLDRDLGSARRVRTIVMIDLEHPTGLMARAPRLLQRGLLFPYAQGTVLAAEHYEAAGNAGLDALLRDPPLSSLRVYQPQDVVPVEFVGLPVAALTRAVAAEGCTPGHQNVTGVLGIRVLLEDHVPDLSPVELEVALRSWSGDRFVHVRCPNRDEVAWFTRWRNPIAARTFAALYARAAPSIAERARLSEPPRAWVRDRDVIVTSAGLGAHRALLETAEVRAYDSIGDWIADGCFPESPCPGAR
jgi:hypothetical protein